MPSYERKIEKIKNISGKRLNYVGEWHTHPEGCSVNPSPDDRIAHEMVCKEMADEGLPGVMLVFGDNQKYRVMIRDI